MLVYHCSYSITLVSVGNLNMAPPQNLQLRKFDLLLTPCNTSPLITTNEPFHRTPFFHSHATQTLTLRFYSLGGLTGQLIATERQTGKANPANWPTGRTRQTLNQAHTRHRANWPKVPNSTHQQLTEHHQKGVGGRCFSIRI